MTEVVSSVGERGVQRTPDFARALLAFNAGIRAWDLKPREKEVALVTGDCSLGWMRAVLRIRARGELVRMTGISEGNLSQILAELNVLNIVQVSRTVDGEVLRPVPDTRLWGGRPKVRLEQIADVLQGLREANGVTQLELLAQEQALREAIAEVALLCPGGPTGGPNVMPGGPAAGPNQCAAGRVLGLGIGSDLQASAPPTFPERESDCRPGEADCAGVLRQVQGSGGGGFPAREVPNLGSSQFRKPTFKEDVQFHRLETVRSSEKGGGTKLLTCEALKVEVPKSGSRGGMPLSEEQRELKAAVLALWEAHSKVCNHPKCRDPQKNWGGLLHVCIFERFVFVRGLFGDVTKDPVTARRVEHPGRWMCKILMDARKDREPGQGMEGL